MEEKLHYTTVHTGITMCGRVNDEALILNQTPAPISPETKKPVR